MSMTTDLAMALIESRMRDMAYRHEDYSVALRHYVLQGGEQREIEAYSEFYFLEHDPDDVSIKSDFGLYDLSFHKANELQYEHQGLILIQNLSGALNHVRFIQVVFKTKKEK